MVSKMMVVLFCFYFMPLLGRLGICLTNACKFWGKWNRNSFRHSWWWGLSFNYVPTEAFREKGFAFEERAVTYRLSQARRCVGCAFGILTAKWRLLNKAIETKAERMVRCICLLHNIIIDLEGTTHDPSILQETSQIHVSRQARTNVSSKSFSRYSKGAIDVRNAFTAYFSGPTAAILSQNQ